MTQSNSDAFREPTDEMHGIPCPNCGGMAVLIFKPEFTWDWLTSSVYMYQTWHCEKCHCRSETRTTYRVVPGSTDTLCRVACGPVRRDDPNFYKKEPFYDKKRDVYD